MVDSSEYDKYKHLWTAPKRIPYRTWNGLTDAFRTRRDIWQGWVFRGDKQDRCHKRSRDKRPGKRLLESTLERTVEGRFQGFQSTKKFEELYGKEKVEPGNELAYIECGMIREFHRKARKYLPHLPPENERMALTAWLQHFGAPTRLIDWTYSFYVAVYFAFNRLNPNREEAVIWALDRDYLYNKAKDVIGRPDDAWDKDETEWYGADRVLWNSKPYSLVYPVNPYELHDRLVAQQGHFLATGDLRKSFMENLQDMWGAQGDKKHFYRLEVEFDLRELARALEDLEDMNINQATLFPGIEGFVKQLENQIVLRDKLYVEKFRSNCFATDSAPRE